MTETMPAFGAERNEKISKLLGWTIEKVHCGWLTLNPQGIVVCHTGSEWSAKCDTPNYCDDDAACFGLLVTLLDHIEIKDLAMGRYGQRVLVTVVLNRPEQVNGLSDFPETNAGWRDAITQAAWLALTAAKETKSPTAPAQPEPQAVTD